MRPEKSLLVDEVSRHLGKSNFAYLVKYTGLTVVDLGDIRTKLAAHGAELHVVKNSLLTVACKRANLPDPSALLGGQIALVSGGTKHADVYKVLTAYHKDKEKLELRGALFEGQAFNAEEFKVVATLPSKQVLLGQILGLLQQPAARVVGVINSGNAQIVNVLQARVRKEEEAAKAA